MAKIVLNIT